MTFSLNADQYDCASSTSCFFHHKHITTWDLRITENNKIIKLKIPSCRNFNAIIYYYYCYYYCCCCYYFHYYYYNFYNYTSNSNHIANLRDHQEVCWFLEKCYYYHALIQSLWTSPDNTFPVILFCVSATFFFHKSSFSNIFSSSFNIFLTPPPKALITSSTTFNFESKSSLSYIKCK